MNPISLMPLNRFKSESMERIYRGISPYDESGEYRFAGRSLETLQLYERIQRNDYTVYYAASGEGKSSLIRAGLLPILRRRGMFPVYIVFRDEDFVTNGCYTNVLISRLEEELTHHPDVQMSFSWEDNPDSEDGLTLEQIETLLEDPWWKLRNLRFTIGGAPLTPLFIFDQFEEVFTKAQYEWTDGYFTWLERISANYPPIEIERHYEEWNQNNELVVDKCFKILFSFRTEYLGDLDYWGIQKHYIPALQENRVCLKPMTPEGAMQVIKLNDDVLGSHANQIIAGCSEGTLNNEYNYPCVSALTLSVVCSVLSEMEETEREAVLDRLVSDQEQTVDTILLRFYTNKLALAGLDYSRDAYIIEQIEDAFVDENGRRKRRSCDESKILSIATWVEKLSLKENGLLKVIGHKYTDGCVINTVEFPHDRLCRAIDVSRKERRERAAEKMNRQTEWTQFGLVTVIVMIIAFLWSSQMESIKYVIYLFLDSQNVITDFKSTFLSFLRGEEAFFGGVSLNAGYTTICGMILMVIILPSLVMSLARKGLIWRKVSLVFATVGSLFFGLLWNGSRSLEFDSPYVTVIIASCCIICAIVLLYLVICFVSILRKRQFLSQPEESSLSMWPLWGGFFLFFAYLFHECLTRTTIGISGPGDSAWALIVLPLIYSMWAWGFFRMRFPDIKKKRTSVLLCFAFGICALLLLTLIAMTPPVSVMFYEESYEYIAEPNLFKRLYGFPLSLLLIAIYVFVFHISIRPLISRSSFFVLSKSKKWGAVSGVFIVLLASFVLNLGYNPLAIPPSSVCGVNSWRTVSFTEKGNPLSVSPFGVMNAHNGDTILPCVLVQDTMVMRLSHSGLSVYMGKVQVTKAFKENPLIDKSSNATPGNLFIWDSDSFVGYGSIIYDPLLEQYIYGKNSFKSFRDSIDYYAAMVYSKLRLSNVRYFDCDDAYTIESLQPELNLLDSLQRIALHNEYDRIKGIERLYTLKDDDFVSLFKELSRAFLICSIRDRVMSGDYTSIFSYLFDYYCVFFSDVDCLGEDISFSHSLILDGESIIPQRTMVLHQDDFNSGNAYPWYEEFHFLCSRDMSFNSTRFETSFKQSTSAIIDVLNELLLEKEKSSIFDETLYEQIIQRLEPFSLLYGGNEMESTFEILINEAFDNLLSILQRDVYCIYNNAFYAICSDLISVAFLRGYDVIEKTDRLRTCYNHTGQLFNVISELDQIDEMRLELITKAREVAERKRTLRHILDSLGIDL